MDSSEPALKVVATVVNDGGVLNITAGAIAGDAFRRHAVALLKALYPTAYSQYRALKFPGATESTRGIATAQSRSDANAFAVNFCAARAIETYIRVESSP